MSNQETAPSPARKGAAAAGSPSASHFNFSSFRNPPSLWPDFLSGQIEKPLRVVVVDDASHVRSVIAPELMNDTRTVLVGQADSVREGRRLVLEQDFDVLIVNRKLRDGSGFDLITYARRVRRAAEVVVVSSVEEDEDAISAFKLGAAGYLVKNSWFGNFVQAVLQVANGGASISPTLARRLLLKFSRESAQSLRETASDGALPGRLSQREREILRMIANGMTSSDIARRLMISQMTVNTHIKNMYHKLHVKTRAQAVSRASDWGVL